MKKTLLVPVILTMFFLLKVEAKTIALELSDSPTIDGVIEESEWSDAYKTKLSYVAFPNKGAVPKKQTVVFVKYDAKFIYFAFDAKEPEKVNSTTTRRDNLSRADRVNLILGPGVKPAKSYLFEVSAAGVQGDKIFSSFGNDNFSWDGEWQSNVKINKDGYVVEIAIPLTLIDYTQGDEVDFRISFGRNFVSETFESNTDSLRKDEDTCVECQFPIYKIKFNKKTQSSKWQVIPAISYAKHSVEGRSSEDHNLSLDANYQTSDGTNFTATIKPDFTDASIDRIQNNLNTRFALFLEENRQFFTQHKDDFSMPVNLFHTRNIQSPDYGVLISKQDSDFGYSALFMKDDYTSFVQTGFAGSMAINESTSSNNFVGTINYQLSDTTIGGYVTNKTSDIIDNTVFATNIRQDFGANQSLSLFYGSSSSSGDGFDEFDGDTYSLKYDFNKGGYFSQTGYTKFDSDFLAALGYIERVGYSSIEHTSGYIFRFGDDDFISSYEPSLSVSNAKDIDGNTFIKSKKLNNSVASEMFVYDLTYEQKDEFIGSQWFEMDNGKHLLVVRPKETLELAVISEHKKAVDFQLMRQGHEHTNALIAAYNLSENLLLDASLTNYKQTTDGFKRFKFENIAFGMEYHFNNQSHLKLILEAGDFEMHAPNGAGQIMAQETKQAQLVYNYELNAFSNIVVGGNWTNEEIPSFMFRERQNVIFAKVSYKFD